MALKIVYCIVGTFNSGGMERVLANKANYLANLGYEVAVVTTDQKGRPHYFNMDSRIKCYDLGINYQDSNQLGVVKKTLRFFKNQNKHLSELRSILLSIKPDVVISMFDHDVDLLWKINDGSRKLVEIHFSRFKRIQYGRRGIWKLIDRWRTRIDLNVVQRYDKFVVLTEEDKKYWGDLHNITVIPNGNTFEPVESADLSIKRVIAVGRFNEQKAFDELISSWYQVNSRFPDWQLVIFGDGALRSYYQELIDGLVLDKVIKLESVTLSIEKEYLSSSIFVMTSRYEGLPMAMLEAQSCGLPLISYACKCGPKDIIIPGENGYLVDEGDQQGLASKLIDLMNDSILREKMGRRSKELSLRFSQTEVMQKWLNLINEIEN